MVPAGTILVRRRTGIYAYDRTSTSTGVYIHPTADPGRRLLSPGQSLLSLSHILMTVTVYDRTVKGF